MINLLLLHWPDLLLCAIAAPLLTYVLIQAGQVVVAVASVPRWRGEGDNQ